MQTKKTPKTIDEYIKDFSPNVREILEQMRVAIQSVAPDAIEAISYGMSTFKLNGNLVHFAAFKNHIGFFPTPSPIVKFKKELSRYKTTKGGIQFPINKSIPFDLVKKIVQYRVKENRK